jgi:hypothetical protein
MKTVTDVEPTPADDRCMLEHASLESTTHSPKGKRLWPDVAWKTNPHVYDALESKVVIAP